MILQTAKGRSSLAIPCYFRSITFTSMKKALRFRHQQYSICLIFLFLSIQGQPCNPLKETTEVHSEMVPPEPTPTPEGKSLPPSWPWRGISIQSEQSTAEDINYLASIGVDFIRIQIKPPIVARKKKMKPMEAFDAELAWADSMVSACAKNGITSMIAFNHLVLDPDSEWDETSPVFWSDKSIRDSLCNLVEVLVKRFAARGPELCAYEVMSEPVVKSGTGAGKSPDELELFYKAVLKKIRLYDKERWFLLTPGPRGRPNNFDGFTPFDIQDEKLIYGAHMYMPDVFTHQGIKERPKGISYPGNIKGQRWDREAIVKAFSSLRAFEKVTGYPVFIGEFQAARWGDGADVWVKDVVETMDMYKWSWAYFAYEAGQNFWDPFYEVENKQESPKNWDLKKTGTETNIWKYIRARYSENRSH